MQQITPRPASLSSPRTVLILLTAAYAVNFADRTIVNTLGQAIKVDLQLSDAELAILGGLSFALLYAVSSLVLARVADRANRVNLLSGAIALWSLLTMLCASAAGFGSLLLMRVGVGIGEAGCSPPAQSLLADYFPPQRRATAVAIYSLGVPIGVLGGAFAAGWVASIWGWRAAFLALGAPGLLLALIVRLLLKEPPRGRLDPHLELADKDELPALRAVVARVWQTPGLVHVMAGYTASAFGAYAIGQFLHPLLVRQFGLTYGMAAVYFGLLIALPGAAGISLGGVIADRWAARRPEGLCLVPAWGALLCAPLLALAFLQSQLWACVALIAVGGTLQMFYQGPSFAVLHNRVSPRMRASTAAIMLFTSTGVGLGFGPLFTGILSDVIARRSYTGSMDFATMCEGADQLGRSAACAQASATGLGIAMSVTMIAFLWSALHFFLAARQLRRAT